jgi:hypothetical protein
MYEIDLDQLLARQPFRADTMRLAIAAGRILSAEQPMTLRGLFYRVVSAGHLPSTDVKHYRQLGRVLTILRERRLVPFHWIVDGVRGTDKPSSWSGLADFAETVRDAYRKDFWASLPEYVHVFCEKDAMAGVLRPVTREYDVSLSIVRGYTSVSLAAAVAAEWQDIEKPITAYYLGDFDPSGFDLERDLREKLERYCPRPFDWMRLAVVGEDISGFDLLPLPPKKKDQRTAAFLRAGHTECFELDAMPAQALRERLTGAIETHIPAAEWDALKRTEALERRSLLTFVKRIRGAG